MDTRIAAGLTGVAKALGGIFAILVLIANAQAASINIATGHLTYDQPVFAATGGSSPLSITLFYESLGTYSSLLGPDWTHSADVSLTPTANSNVLVFRNGNSRTYYHQSVDGSYLSQSGDTSVLTRDADTGNYLIAMSDGARFQLNSNGRLTAIVDPFNNTQSFVYDSTTDELATITDPAGRTATFEYATINNQRRLAKIAPPGVSVSDPDSKKYQFVFTNNSTAQLTKVLQPLADDEVGTLRGSWDYTYDANGRLKTATDPGSNITCYNYYPDGRIQSSVDPEGLPDVNCQATVPGHTRSIVYNDSARTATITDKSGNQWLYAYNSEIGKLSSKQSPDSAITSEKSYYYPQTGYLKARTEPFGASQAVTTFYTYDDNGNKIADTDPIDLSRAPYIGIDPDTVDTSTFGVTSPIQWARSYQYYPANDPDLTRKNRLRQVADNRSVPPAVTIYDRYDEEGLKVLKITDPENRISYTKSYPDGRIRYSIDGNGKTTTYDYYPDTPENRAAGAAGLLWKVTGPDGILSTITSYDKSGNPGTITITAANGTVRETIVNQYDNLYRLSTTIRTVTGLAPIVTRYGYDANGNTNSIIDAENKETKHEYNYNRQVTKFIQYKDSLPIETGFEYGAPGCPSCSGGGNRLTKLTDAKQHATTYEYDKLGRLEYETDPIGKRFRYTYYDNGLIREKYDATIPGAEIKLVTYEYYDNSQLKKKLYPDSTEETYTYYPDGKLKTTANSAISYTYQWYANGLLKSVTDTTRNITINYDEYDGIGQKKTVTLLPNTPDQHIYNYDYDQANRPWHITSSAGTFTYGHDELSRRKTILYPNGITATYGYDDLNRLTSLTHTDGTNTITAALYPEHDKVGNRKQKTTTTTAEQYLYDDLYRLMTVTVPKPEAFDYDNVGNRTKGPGAKDINTYDHDAANRMTHGRKLNYGYDNAGNQTIRTIPGAFDKTWTQTWDHENRLTKVEKTKGSEKRTITFKYDPFGRRTEKLLTTTKNSITKTSNWSYVYDGDDITMEIYTDENNTTTKTFYTHGPGTDEHLALERNGQAYFYHADGLGSVTAITDASKTVVQAYTYDSFGMPTPSTGFRNAFQFAGRPWDKEIGLYFNEARYYDPMEGRFISKDPIGFAGGDVNLFGYTSNNPINYTDSSGLATDQGGKGPLTSQDPDVQRAVDMAKKNLQEAKRYLKDVIRQLEDELKKFSDLCKRKDLIRRLEHLRGALKVLDRYFRTPVIIINPDLYPNPTRPQNSET